MAHLIQQELGRLFTKGFKDPRITGFVTITGVKLSPDLKQAVVYYSVLGEPSEPKETAAGLKAAVGYIRREVGQTLSLRYTPEIKFIFDEAIERGDRIERLIKEIKDRDAEARSEDETKE
ncbi:Ribosome-binding factor A [Vulgatibacter incomptus]|uniref:Ribosome-binding factor A n=1 Tax=Vulgatibacter incomptus TaxID=1391653 RepID=A0A0K1P9C4_9BACT|nr:Ribosome-binding factor A [Vulgatibacter incomptus]